MIPADLDLLHGFALAFPFVCWALYAPFLKLSGRGTLNTQLHNVRVRWMQVLLTTNREKRTFDAVVLGHISNSMSFFGSATLLVMAGLLGTLANIHNVYQGMADVQFAQHVSRGLFTIQFAALTLIMTICFFDFMYALRKLAYTLAMVGALGEVTHTVAKTSSDPATSTSPEDARAQIMACQTATVLTESVRSLNNGIRGFYYAVATLFLFVGPWYAIGMTALVTLVLLYRQGFSPTAKAIEGYVDAMNQKIEPKNGSET